MTVDILATDCPAPTISLPGVITVGQRITITGDYWRGCGDPGGGCGFGGGGETFQEVSILLAPVGDFEEFSRLWTRITESEGHEGEFSVEVMVPDVPKGRYLVRADGDRDYAEAKVRIRAG